MDRSSTRPEGNSSRAPPGILPGNPVEEEVFGCIEVVASRALAGKIAAVADNLEVGSLVEDNLLAGDTDSQSPYPADLLPWPTEGANSRIENDPMQRRRLPSKMLPGQSCK